MSQFFIIGLREVTIEFKTIFKLLRTLQLLHWYPEQMFIVHIPLTIIKAPGILRKMGLDASVQWEQSFHLQNVLVKIFQKTEPIRDDK